MRDAQVGLKPLAGVSAAGVRAGQRGLHLSERRGQQADAGTRRAIVDGAGEAGAEQ